MFYTLRVIVEPYEGSVEKENSTEDRNVYLVRRGLPTTYINTGHGTESRTNTRFVEVQQVVVFEFDGTRPLPTQIEFLEHLKREHVIKAYEQYNDRGQLVE